MEDKILRKAATKKGKTKDELALALGVGHSYVSRLVNRLVGEGKLAVVGQDKPHTGRPAPRYSSKV